MVGFPAEVYKGVTYQTFLRMFVLMMTVEQLLQKQEKRALNFSQNNDEGEGWGGMRDLDHKSGNVQKIVKAYENFLLNDLGYAGFRYDMVKGFAASHVGDYNTAANVKYSVGDIGTAMRIL